jgi:Ser/Thr protein kinase RdoA (MazF antagonist)
VASPALPVVYSTPFAMAVADFVSTHYDLPGSLECTLLRRGFNDTFEIRTKDGERFILRVSARRARGDADVASETEFLAYLDQQGIPVAAAIPARDGSLFSSAFFPEGHRPAVLFRHAEGRASQGNSAADARANGVTLARIHDVAGGFPAGDKGRYRLDADHLLHRPLSAILALGNLRDSVSAGLADLSGRLSRGLAERDELSRTRCHGDCHGYNAHIAQQGPHAGQAVFFDFDDGGPGYLAYDLAVFLWACVSFGRKQHAAWHAFIEGYRAIRELPHADFEAVHLFVPIRHMWLLGGVRQPHPRMGQASRVRRLDRRAVGFHAVLGKGKAGAGAALTGRRPPHPADSRTGSGREPGIVRGRGARPHIFTISVRYFGNSAASSLAFSACCSGLRCGGGELRLSTAVPTCMKNSSCPAGVHMHSM